MSTPGENERLLELYHYELLDSESEANFDEIVQLATQVCGVPMSLISLVDSSRQWFKARKGLELDETPREYSFCAHAIAGEHEVFEVPDAQQDQRFLDNPLVTGDPNIRFYAGIPLITSRGQKLGTLCVLDSKPRNLDKQQLFALKVLANQVIKLAEQRLQNKYLQSYRKRLEMQASMQNRILSIVAHDVRSPLVSLQGIIELSEENIISGEKKLEMIGLWKKQLDNTMGLLSNLVDWGKLQAGGDPMATKPVNLHRLIEDEMARCQEPAAKKNTRLENKVPAEFPVLADENILCFIVRNILGNAVKFTENGSIRISAERDKNLVTLTVADTGIGMSEQQMAELVAGNITMVGLGTRNEKGSGLGFLLIRDFISMLDGELRIESALGQGTTIRITLNC